MSEPEEKKHWLEPPEWWKKSKPLRWVPMLIAIGIIAPGLWVAKEKLGPSSHPEKEKYTAVMADGVLFLDGLKSYDTLGAAKAVLDSTKTVYSVVAVHPKASSKYPPRDRDTLQSAAYQHLGVEGNLTLEFFNDRLYEATFAPATLEEYVEKLHKADPRLKRDRNGRAEQVVGNLRMASNVDFAMTDVGKNLRTKPYVIWQDLRLTAQLDEWDQHFIALP
jgi:hypothetical protein